MNNKELLTNAGSVYVEYFEILKANGPGLDVLPILESINIYEDVFSPFISGKAVIRDTLDIPNELGRSGNDLIRLKVYTPSLKKQFHIEGYFYLYKIGERTLVKDRMQLYTLFFSSAELLTDINVHLSKQFKGTGDSIVQQIAKKYYPDSTKKILADPATNQIAYVSNFWTPSKNFSYIADHSVSAKGTASFMFFENREGLNFKELSSLADSNIKPIQEFSGSDYTSTVQDEGMRAGSVTRDVSKEYNNIHGIRVDTTYDFIKDYMDGAIKSKLYSVDPITKKIRWSIYDMQSTKNNLNANLTYREDVISTTNPVIMTKNRGYGTFGLSETSNYRHVQRRTSYMRLLQSSKIEIDVYGRTDYTVGKKVKVVLNKLKSIVQSSSQEEILDQVYSGVYIITAIAHQITRESHKCTLELCKESTLLK